MLAPASNAKTRADISSFIRTLYLDSNGRCSLPELLDLSLAGMECQQISVQEGDIDNYRDNGDIDN